MDYPGLFEPCLDKFRADPFGYALLGWFRWQMMLEAVGLEANHPVMPPSQLDLTNPVLWLSQAQALTEAAVLIINATPEPPPLPPNMAGLFDGQFRAAGLMLVGYSLEVCLKGMIILKEGPNEYQKKPKETHNLVDLAEFIPSMTEKDCDILKLLTFFVKWAGRYPAPRERDHHTHEEVFSLSERHQIALKDVTGLAAKVMAHTRVIIDGEVEKSELKAG